LDEVTVIEIKYLKEAIDDLKKQNKDLNDKLTEVILFVHELKAMRKWLYASISVAAVLGGLISQAIHLIKVVG